MIEKYKETLENLRLYSPVNKKVRYGRNGDGGYVIIDSYNYDYFISAGIDDEVSFDKDFVKNHTTISGVAFDGTVNRPPDLPENILFNKMNIGVSNTETTTNLRDIIDSHKDVFIKMDIEGEEWRWIYSLGDSIKNVKQFVFEAHALFAHNLTQQYRNCHCLGYAPDIWDDYVLNALKKLNETHYLVHVHENLVGPFVNFDGNEYPHFLELTYIRKDCEINGLNTDNLPVPLIDYPVGQRNMYGSVDKPLNFWPFKF